MNDYKFFTDKIKQEIIAKYGCLVTAGTKPKKEELGEATIVDFQCAYCDGQWSIENPPKRKRWYCPWCGSAHKG